jgi:hypothetical protein
MPDDQIAQAIGREEMGLAMQLARAGRNPIDTVYSMAKAFGYQRKEIAKEELPKVQGQKQLPPDQTLGTGAAVETDPKEGESDPFTEAFSEMFGRRKAS